jgi:hypothetical protein
MKANVCMRPNSVAQRIDKQMSIRNAVLLSSLLTFAVLPGKSQGAEVVGNISPNSIEIDTNANLYASGAAGFVDWVKDSLTNTDTPSISNSIATGIIPNVTGVAGGTGHWNGVRIVDPVGGNDVDIFINGGKENDTSTWTVGAGSVGSSKYDITQAYLANNQANLFFGMERGGNNGTTAFDFEFNQAGPNSATPYIPTRTIGDVLFTFEMSGSGTSGSALPHFFIWNGSAYVEKIPAPASLVSSINSVDTPAGPWGYIDRQGNWASGSIPRFQFAEASVKLTDAFPNFNACNNSAAFIQVRTRSSATASSDLKDTTKIFQFRFGGPSSVVSLGTTCLGQLLFDGSASKDSSGSTNITYSWNLTPPSGVTLSGAGITGPDGSGVYHSTLISGTADVGLPAGVDSATIKANLSVTEGASCKVSSGDISFTVTGPLKVGITQKDMNGSTLTVTLTGSAPAGTSLQWQRLNAANTWVNISGATSSTLAYSSFEADVTPTVANLTIAGDPYQGRVYQVQIRVHGERTINGVVCMANSAPVTVKKVTAVDP